MISDPDDRYLLWDAAYVLGSLSSSQRREYEAHLSGCRTCRSAVGELSGMPALLTMLSPEDVASIDDGPTPPSIRPQMLDELLTEVSRRRGRTRRRAGIAVAAAAAVIAAAVVIADGPGPFGTVPAAPSESARVPETSLSMTPVAPSPLEAEMVVASQPWGTHIQITCTYHPDPADGVAADDGEELSMVAVGRDGARIPLATWMAIEGKTASPAGSTAMAVDQIAAVQIMSVATGGVLMQRSL